MRKLYPTYLLQLLCAPVFLFFGKIKALKTFNWKFSSLRYATLAALLFILGNANPVQAQLPDEFQKVDLLTGLSNATTMQFAPDGRIFILDRYGEVIIYKTDTQTSVSAGNIPVFHQLEDGLLGIAFDPDFANNNYIYLYYSPQSYVGNRVSRFEVNGDDLDLVSEVILLQWPTSRVAKFHSGGDMGFDSQGNLYIATGDNTTYGNLYAPVDEADSDESAEKASSNTNDLRGKILRITPQANGTYTVPSGNLFPPGTANTLPEIYVMGARNPYRIFVDKENTDWLWWGEVGPDADVADSRGPEGLDEINLTKSAGNYGWPYFSGVDNDAYQIPYRSPFPFYNDPSAPENTSVWNTGLTALPSAQPAWLEFFHRSYFAGPRYYYDPSLTDDQRFPVEFDEMFLYYDFNRSIVFAVSMDAQGNIVNNERIAPSVFPSNADGFIDMDFGPDGKLYILAYGTGCCPQNVGTGRLIRVDYTGITTNAPPTVMISADPNNGSLPLLVNFSSAGTTDPNGDSPLSYFWDFDGDGNTDSTEENPVFTYTTLGNYNVQLRVDDGNGGIGVNNLTIYAGNNAADFTFNAPPDGGLFNWDDDVNVNLTVTDFEDGNIDCNNVNLVPALGHLNHFHNGPTQTGCPTTINIDPASHETQGQDIFYVLNADYTDSGGLQAFDQIILHPKRKEAEFFDTQSGTEIISNTDPLEGGLSAIRVDNNGYISFSGRDLTNITGVKYKVASALAGGTIEIRTGSSSGPLLVTTNVPNTGGVENWQAINTTFSPPSGKNDLFFVFRSTSGSLDIFDLNYVEFIGQGISTDNSPPLVNSVMPNGSTEVRVQFSEYVSQATAEQLANYSIDNGVSISSANLLSDDLTVSLIVSPLGATTTYNLTVSRVENLVGIPIVTASHPFVVPSSVRINAGGPELTAGSDTFGADDYFFGGSIFTNVVPIEGTTDDALYQTERYDDFTYDIPVSVPGTYDIRLHFAEIFHGVEGNPGGQGSRVFNVSIEGIEVLSNFDILSEVAPATVLIKEFDDVTITDSFINIQFTSVTGDPKVSAIEILPPDALSATPSIAILSPSEGWSVNQPFDVNFTVQNWEIAQGGTHMHYYVDGLMIGPHYSYGPVEIDGLSIGSHTIRLELYNANHTPTGIFDEVTVNVTNALSCNDNPFPDQWQVHQLQASANYRTVRCTSTHTMIWMEMD